MARGSQLIQLVDQLRAEIGHSQNAALGQNFVQGLKSVLRRQQEALYDAHDWEHLKVWRLIPMQAGEREYSFPADLNGDRTIKGYFRGAGTDRWRPVKYGITLDHYNVLDSDDPAQRRDIVEAWMQVEGTQIEVWPRPATNAGFLRLRGIKKLNPLVSDDQRADLDDLLIVLHSAAEFLAKQKSPDAQLKLSKAQERFTTLKRNAPAAKNEVFVMGGGCDPMEEEDGHRYRSAFRDRIEGL